MTPQKLTHQVQRADRVRWRPTRLPILIFCCMRVYVHNTASEREFFLELKRALDRLGHITCSRTPLDFDHKASIVTALRETIDHIDLVIVNTYGFSSEEISSVSMALGRHIPVLCMHPRGTIIPEAWQALLADHTLRRRFRFLSYDNRRIEDQLRRLFLKWTAVARTREYLGYAKFTLRLPAGMVDRVNECAHRSRTPKAVLIRQWIDEMLADAESDEQLSGQLPRQGTVEGGKKDQDPTKAE